MKSCDGLEDLKKSLAKIKDDVDLLILRIGEDEVLGKEDISHESFMKYVRNVYAEARKDAEVREQILEDYYEILATYEEEKDNESFI